MNQHVISNVGKGPRINNPIKSTRDGFAFGRSDRVAGIRKKPYVGIGARDAHQGTRARRTRHGRGRRRGGRASLYNSENYIATGHSLLFLLFTPLLLEYYFSKRPSDRNCVLGASQPASQHSIRPAHIISSALISNP